MTKKIKINSKQTNKQKFNKNNNYYKCITPQRLHRVPNQYYKTNILKDLIKLTINLFFLILYKNKKQQYPSAAGIHKIILIGLNI